MRRGAAILAAAAAPPALRARLLSGPELLSRRSPDPSGYWTCLGGAAEDPYRSLDPSGSGPRVSLPGVSLGSTRGLLGGEDDWSLDSSGSGATPSPGLLFPSGTLTRT